MRDDDNGDSADQRRAKRIIAIVGQGYRVRSLSLQLKNRRWQREPAKVPSRTAKSKTPGPRIKGVGEMFQRVLGTYGR